MDTYSRIITGFDLQPTLSSEGPYNALRQTVDFYQLTKVGYGELLISHFGGFKRSHGCKSVFFFRSIW